MSQKEDFYYLDQILSGNVSAYQNLVDRHKNHSYRLAIQIVKNKEDAEEITQDAFIRAFRSIHKFNRTSAFSTWLYRIVYNSCIDHIRKRPFHTVNLSEVPERDLSGYAVGTENPLADAERKKFLREAIESLPMDEQTLVNLFYVHEKDMNEIGQIMNLTHANVRKKISRARQKIKEHLEKILDIEWIDLL